MKNILTLLPENTANKVTGALIACLFFAFQASAQRYYPAGLGNTNLKLWLTAADPTTILTTAGTPAASGNTVAKWKDKSGAGADAVQATGAAQPVYTSNVMNGLGALVFQNTNQYFTGAAGAYQTIVSARNITGTSGGTNYHYLFSSPANSDFSIRNNGGGPGAYAVSYTDGPNVNDWCYGTGGTSTQWINGTQSLTGSTTNHILVDAAATATNNTYSISSTFMSRGMFGNDPVYELLAYNTTLNTTQRRLLENYEAAEWGMVSSLPTSGYTVFTPPTAATYNKNLVGIGYTSSTDNFLTNPANSTDGLGFSSTSTATGFLNTAGYIMAAHSGQANTTINNAVIPGITGSNIFLWARRWYLQKTGGNASGQVTLNFNFNDYNGTTPTTTANFAIIYNATDGSFATGTNRLISTIGGATFSGSNVAFLVNAANLLNGFYTVAYSTTSVLPVSFTSFSATAGNGSVPLHWSVADEAANDVFQIQRSADGIKFNTIGSLAGSTVSTAAASYSFTDENPAAGNNYYRILLTDIAGKIIYSDIKTIKTNSGTQATVSVYPNPATNFIQVDMHSSSVRNTSMQLINAAGQAVTVALIIPSSGIQHMPVSHLSNGVYYLEINTNGAINTVKIVKK